MKAGEKSEKVLSKQPLGKSMDRSLIILVGHLFSFLTKQTMTRRI